MALDEAILVSGIPTLRFYEWQPACISVGYFQNPLREVNNEYCRKHNIDVVRRPTGGKAVLHEYELTYSLVVPENHFGTQVIQSYRAISQVFVTAFKKLRIPIQIRAKGNFYNFSYCRFSTQKCTRLTSAGFPYACRSLMVIRLCL